MPSVDQHRLSDSLRTSRTIVGEHIVDAVALAGEYLNRAKVLVYYMASLPFGVDTGIAPLASSRCAAIFN